MLPLWFACVWNEIKKQTKKYTEGQVAQQGIVDDNFHAKCIIEKIFRIIYMKM